MRFAGYERQCGLSVGGKKVCGRLCARQSLVKGGVRVGGDCAEVKKFTRQKVKRE